MQHNEYDRKLSYVFNVLAIADIALAFLFIFQFIVYGSMLALILALVYPHMAMWIYRQNASYNGE